jgi:arsenate reductase
MKFKLNTMGEIATSKRQITLFYNSNSIRAKKTIAFASAEGLPIQEVDLLKTKLTGTQIVELADKLSLKVSELVNQKHPSYLSLTEPHDFSTDDWIKTIQHNPQIMKQPIALKGNHSILIETPTDILKI